MGQYSSHEVSSSLMVRCVWMPIAQGMRRRRGELSSSSVVSPSAQRSLATCLFDWVGLKLSVAAGFLKRLTCGKERLRVPQVFADCRKCLEIRVCDPGAGEMPWKQ